MSRCFPYPPPGFEKKHDPLIESSIKLQKEKDREKKERKKEKKEKKREKKEKFKDGTVQKEEKHGHKKRHREDRIKLDLKDEYQSKAKEEEIEQLERSSLTEEQGLPSSQYLCDSPDSSQNSSKRIKLDATDAPVSVLRIRLPSLKQIESRNPSLPNQSTLSVSEQKNIELPALSEFPSTPLLEHRQIAQIDSVVGPCLPVVKQRIAGPSVPDKEPCFSGRTETTDARKETNDGCDDFSLFERFQGSSKSRKKEVKFRDLIVNWHPQPLQIDEGGVDDQDWLFDCARQQKGFDTKDAAVESRVPAQGNVLSSWPPRACHHPEADVNVSWYIGTASGKRESMFWHVGKLVHSFEKCTAVRAALKKNLGAGAQPKSAGPIENSAATWE